MTEPKTDPVEMIFAVTFLVLVVGGLAVLGIIAFGAAVIR